MSLLFEEIPLSPKLELCHANQDHIRNQRLDYVGIHYVFRSKRGGLSKGVPAIHETSLLAYSIRMHFAKKSKNKNIK